MFKKAFFLVLIISVLSACTSGGSDKASRDPDSNACDLLGLKIINGSSCSSNRSAVVRLIHVDSSGNGFSCTGTLIAPNKVLTAAHCAYSDIESLTPLTASGLRISSDTSGTTLAHSSAIAVHPQFESVIDRLSKRINFKSAASDFADQILSTGFPDVAVVTLDRNLNLPTLPVLVSKIPDSGTIVSIFGYGLTSPSGSTGSSHLISGEMSLEQNGVDNYTAIFGDSGSNTCQGDSGGPALVSPADTADVKEVAVSGITSLGFGSADQSSCTQGEISVFTATAGAQVAPFIISNAANARFL